MKIIRIVIASGVLLAGLDVAASNADCRQRAQRTSARRSPVALASASYKQRGDAASLLILFGHLKVGMPRKDVERLLGRPNYSPTEGQYYYGSDASCSHDVENPSAPCGVVVDYRKPPEYTPTEYLQSCWFGAIAE